MCSFFSVSLFSAFLHHVLGTYYTLVEINRSFFRRSLSERRSGSCSGPMGLAESVHPR